MRTIFVDTLFWVARLLPPGQWHERAVEVEYEIALSQLVTSELVLIEVLNYFAAYRADIKTSAALALHDLLASGEVEMIWHTQAHFDDGFALYQARLDKGYSLTDCVSMNLMRERGINEVLTHDRHFAQEGFTILL